jgi:hypothetical protein
MGPNAASPEGTGSRQLPVGSGAQQLPAGTGARPQPTTGSYQSASRDTRSPSQLDRDYAARQRGNQQFQQRAGGMSRGMGRRR